MTDCKYMTWNDYVGFYCIIYGSRYMTTGGCCMCSYYESRGCRYPYGEGTSNES